MPKKFSLHIYITLLCLIVSGELCTAKIIGRVGSEVTHSLIWENKLRRQIEFLSDSLCGGRVTGSQGAVEAAFWIARKFEKLGLTPFDGSWGKHFYTHGGHIGRNIMGFMPASKKGPRDKYIVIAAHYDGIGTLDGVLYPGADSNASGVVSMLGLAEMLKAMTIYGKSYGANIIFVALDGKGFSMKGSQSLWQWIENEELRDPIYGTVINKDNVTMMMNIDQIGSSLSPLNSGDRNFIIMLGGKDGYFASALRAANLQFGIGLEIADDYYGSKEFTKLFYERISDQKPFVEHGKRAALFTSGLTMNNNKPTDTVATLDLEVLKKRIWLMFHWLEKII